MNEPELITLAEAAARFRYSKRWLNRLVNKGILPARTLTPQGRKRFVNPEDVRRLLVTCQATEAEPAGHLWDAIDKIVEDARGWAPQKRRPRAAITVH